MEKKAEKLFSGPLGKAYRAMLDSRAIEHDSAQSEVLMELIALSHVLLHYRPKSKFSEWLSKPHKAPPGLYIWGDVGRGKSMLMDLFFDYVGVEKKRRVHFHAFMLEIHRRLHALRQIKAEDPILRVAHEIAKETWLLCFDEMQVTDIGDAMILGRLFSELFNRGVVVVCTSNRPVDDLYKDGLQRERFLPFIALFKEQLKMIELAGEQDYRLKHLKSLKTTYATPLNKKSELFLSEAFKELTHHSIPETRTLQLKGRLLEVKKTCGGVAWFSFPELCEQPLGAEDYLEIARCFHTVLLANIPVLGKEMRNEAKRFVTLVDALYEHKTKLIATAESLPQELYPTGDGSFEFARTASRLIEMQSENYLGTSHEM